jgi:hypothetical protein
MDVAAARRTCFNSATDHGSREKLSLEGFLRRPRERSPLRSFDREKSMKKIYAIIAAMVLCSGVVLAADAITVTGEGKCAKCALGETKKCQNVIEVEEGGKTVKYYLADNKVAKAYHKNVCQSTVKTTATGEVKEEDGKKVLTATEVKEAK